MNAIAEKIGSQPHPALYADLLALALADCGSIELAIATADHLYGQQAPLPHAPATIQTTYSTITVEQATEPAWAGAVESVELSLETEVEPAPIDFAVGEDWITAPPHKYASTQFDLAEAGYNRSQGSPVPKLKAMADAIPDVDLAEDGREDEKTFHVTALYGLKTDDAGDVDNVVDGFGPVVVMLGRTSIFPASGAHEYDVVKVAVESPDLMRLNKLLSDSLPRKEADFPYSPHLTIAYVKPGLGHKYANLSDVNGMVVHFDSLIFSDASKKRTTIQLVDEGTVQLAHDIENRVSQGILNRALTFSNRMSADLRRKLEAVARDPSHTARQARLAQLLREYRYELTRLLSATQLASLLEGMQEVAGNLPSLPPHGYLAPAPPALEMNDAKKLVERLALLPRDQQERELYKLPPDQQTFIRGSLTTSSQPAPLHVPAPPPGTPEALHWPVIEEAAKGIMAKNLLTRWQFDRASDAARQKAFTVAGVMEMETLNKIRDVVAQQVATGPDVREGMKALDEAVGKGTFLSTSHMELVLRNGIQGAFSDGQLKVWSHPLVRTGLPYAAVSAIHDDRVRPEHLAMEKHGIGRTNVFRVTDPVFQMFRGPWSWACRCGFTLLSVRQAAERGIPSAVEWLRTGREPPAHTDYVPMPPFQPPPTFRRPAGVPLSIQFSLEPLEFVDDNDSAICLAHQVHQPAPPGPNWKMVGVGSKGGHIWEYAGKEAAPPTMPTVKPRPVKAGFHGINRQKDGSYTDKDAKPLPEELNERAKKMRLPPAWTNVQIAADHSAELQAIGYDEKGRQQWVYSAAHWEKADAEKFLRNKALLKELPILEKRIRKTLDGPDGPEKEAAGALLLIRKMGFRIGSETDTKTEHKALGATTLTADNVHIKDDDVTFDFIGKKGVRIQQHVKDAGLAKLLAPRVAKGGKLFDTSDAATRDYLHSIDGVFKPKDFRTLKAAELALGAIKSLPEPANEKQFKKLRSEVAKVVAAKLGNTPSVALKSYIPPEIFLPWRQKLKALQTSTTAST